MKRYELTQLLRRRPATTVFVVAAVAGFCMLWSTYCTAQSPVTDAVPIMAAAQNSGTEPDKSRSLPTRPVGSRIFRALVELEDTAEIAPGDKVDIAFVSLGDEGPATHRIMRNVTVFSVEPPPRSAADDRPAAPAPGEEDASLEEEEPLPIRTVGLIVNGPQLETLRLAAAQGMLRLHASLDSKGGIFAQIWGNFTSNLFQPLLLFFFLGFAAPLLKVPFEFPKILYESLTIYLLLAIGWHGGELMAQQSFSELAIAGGLAVVGFGANAIIGVSAAGFLRRFTPLRRIDAVTVGGFYGSDSAGTFVTCLGILATLDILHDSYMPVMLAIMEIPGCLVALFLVSRLRQNGMDQHGNMPGERGFDESLVKNQDEGATSIISGKLLHEVLLNPGLFLLFGGIVVGFFSGLQAIEDPHVVEGPNHLFIFIFKGALCLFLLEMGMTACKRLGDLKTAGWGFIAFGLLAPNVFATFGMLAMHGYSLLLGHEFFLGTYALFAVLCGAASYIAVPAVQRLAIPEASPTLPLAAALGLTFTWNVTLGIPIYIEIAKLITTVVPVS